MKETKQKQLRITFDTDDLNEANVLAEEMKDSLMQECQIESIRQNKDENTQDLGSIIIILLGAKPIIEIAQGISVILQRMHSKTITIYDENEKIVGENLSSKDIEKILETFERTKKENAS
jgi:hypothetical protein